MDKSTRFADNPHPQGRGCGCGLSAAAYADADADWIGFPKLADIFQYPQDYFSHFKVGNFFDMLGFDAAAELGQ